MNTHHFRSLAALGALCLGVSACGDDDVEELNPPTIEGTTPGTIANFLATDSRFTVLATTLQRAGLVRAFDAGGETVTLFAPTDAAFNALPNTFLASANFASSGNPDLLTTVLSQAGLEILLRSHTAAGRLTAAQVKAATAPLTPITGGRAISVNVIDPTPANATLEEQGDEFPILNGRAQIVEDDVSLSNGVVHVIDAVFVPSAELAAAGEIDGDTFPGTLYNLLDATPLFEPLLQDLRDGGLKDTLARLNNGDAPQTVFAPSFGVAAAATSLGKARQGDVARLHLVDGSLTAVQITGPTLTNAALAQLQVSTTGGVAIENTAVVVADLRASNGVLHVTNGVIPFPPLNAPADVLTTQGRFSTLVGALNSIPETGTKLLEALRNPTAGVTLFAPTNAALQAFNGLDLDINNDNKKEGLLKELTAAQLETILNYHLSGTVTALDLTAGPLPSSLTMGDTNTVALQAFTDTRILNKVYEITETLGTTGNDSYVHAIGNVLVPPGAALAPPENSFPGANSEALNYFSVLSEFAAAARTELKIQPTGFDVIFTGSLEDVLRFRADDPALLVKAEDAKFQGQLKSPFAVDTDGDGTVDQNLSFQPTTVFAPVNAALPKNLAEVPVASGVSGFAEKDIAPYHVVFGSLTAAQLTTGALSTLTVTTAGASGAFDVAVNVGTAVTLNNNQSTVQSTNIETENGVIHLVDTVITPLP